MSEEQEKPDATKSLCWNCKHGMCIQETQRNHLVHGGMPGIFPPPQQENMDGFSVDSFGEEEEMPDLVEHIIEEETVRTVCFWRPEGVEHAPPVATAHVDKCSRFEEKS